MPIRFRKSFTPFPGVRVNVSKGGTSITVGKKGYHLNFSKRGVRQTVGLPGSGISETSYILKNEEKSEAKKSTESESKKSEHEADEVVEEPKQHTTRPHRTPAWLLLLALVVIYFGAVLLGLIPTNF